MRILDAFNKYILAGGAAFALLAPLDTAQAFHVLYSFKGGSDGGFPEEALMKDAAGNLYGTTDQGGGTGCSGFGCGTVFKLAPDDTETVLHAFTGENDGANPRGRLIEDAAGNLYDTTINGGASGFGTVFKLAPDGTLTVLYAFTGGADGGNPQAGLIEDKRGNLYGTTLVGNGNVFKLAPNGTLTVLYTFTGGNDGAGPHAGLIREAGNLYSTTEYGGTYGDGTVFKLAPDGTETVLYSFTGRSDGNGPAAGLIRDKSGNFYSTTYAGGAYGYGTVFKLATDGTLTVLDSFASDGGGSPLAGVIIDAAGNLYGTTTSGGYFGDGCSFGGCGFVFKLAPDGTETELHTFTLGSDGASAYASLTKDKHGHLVGTATEGGDCTYCGTVFELKK